VEVGVELAGLGSPGLDSPEPTLEFVPGTLGKVSSGGDRDGSFGTAGTIPTTPEEAAGAGEAEIGVAEAEEATGVDESGNEATEVDDTAAELLLAAAAAEVVEGTEGSSVDDDPAAISAEGTKPGAVVLMPSNEAPTVAFGLPFGSTKVISARPTELTADRTSGRSLRSLGAAR